MLRDRGGDRTAGKTASKTGLGRHGEDLALARLEREGFRILARNLRTRRGEIDLVALEGSTLCFIEVRLRSRSDYGSSAASIDGRKRRRLIAAARELLARERFPPHAALRFDVVAIDGVEAAGPRVEILRGAFDADGG
jgi:putative endonuclease